MLYDDNVLSNSVVLVLARLSKCLKTIPNRTKTLLADTYKSKDKERISSIYSQTILLSITAALFISMIKKLKAKLT